MEVPETLRAKMELYRSRGRIVRVDHELFAEVGWLQVLHGQRGQAEGYHPLADLMGEKEIGEHLGDIASVVATCVNQMPSHAAYIAARCASR